MKPKSRATARTTPGKVALFISASIGMSRKTQRQIAQEAGFKRPNMISMIKQGQTRLPLDKVMPLAKALEVDPGRLLRLALAECEPEMLQVIESIMGVIVTDNEAEILKVVRDATDDMDPKMRHPEREKLRAWATQLRDSK